MYFKTIAGRSDDFLHFLKIKIFCCWIHQNYLVALKLTSYKITNDVDNTNMSRNVIFHQSWPNKGLLGSAIIRLENEPDVSHNQHGVVPVCSLTFYTTKTLKRACSHVCLDTPNLHGVGLRRRIIQKHQFYRWDVQVACLFPAKLARIQLSNSVCVFCMSAQRKAGQKWWNCYEHAYRSRN